MLIKISVALQALCSYREVSAWRRLLEAQVEQRAQHVVHKPGERHQPCEQSDVQEVMRNKKQEIQTDYLGQLEDCHGIHTERKDGAPVGGSYVSLNPLQKCLQIPRITNIGIHYVPVAQKKSVKPWRQAI